MGLQTCGQSRSYATLCYSGLPSCGAPQRTYPDVQPPPLMMPPGNGARGQVVVGGGDTPRCSEDRD